ncbi:MAG: hypothetical protein RIB43_00390 [Rhodospirillaceae bacterium]
MTVVYSATEGRSPGYLIWEDAEKETWWLARSHSDGFTFVIAPDSITSHVLVLRQAEGGKDHRIIVAVPLTLHGDLVSAIAEAKRLAVRWVSEANSPEIISAVRSWRAKRWTRIALKEVPLAFVAVMIGVALSFFVSAFFIMTNFTGWTMVIVGTLLGLASGWLLKWAADRKFTSLMGPLGRFITVVGGATLGALLTVTSFLVLFSGVPPT